MLNQSIMEENEKFSLEAILQEKNGEKVVFLISGLKPSRGIIRNIMSSAGINYHAAVYKEGREISSRCYGGKSNSSLFRMDNLVRYEEIYSALGQELYAQIPDEWKAVLGNCLVSRR